MSISGSHSYKKVVQLALRVEKLTDERMSRDSFQKRKEFGFMSGQSSKKSHSFESSKNYCRSRIDSFCFPQSI